MFNRVTNLLPMKVYNCVWCGCELSYKDDVCFQHTRQLLVLRAHIEAALNDDRREHKLYQEAVVVDSMVLSRKIEEQIQIESVQRMGDIKSNGAMSDEEQRTIFRSLGIAV